MRDILRRYQPDRIEDLCALNALYRPGPIQGGMVDDFIERKHGRKPVAYDLPELKELLEETYGVIVYQEQVMQISNRSPATRWAMPICCAARWARRSRRRWPSSASASSRARWSERLSAEEDREDLRSDGAVRGLRLQQVALGGLRVSGVCHGVSEGALSVDFMAALLTSETGNTAKVVKYINECREMGIRVLPPDVNESDLNFTPTGEAIRFGLGAVKNVGQGAVEAIVAARDEGGPIQVDFRFLRTRQSRRGQPPRDRKPDQGRRDGFAERQSRATDRGHRSRHGNGIAVLRDREMGQAGLVRIYRRQKKSTSIPLANLPHWTSQQMLAGEKEMLGIYVSGHPLDRFADKVGDLATHTTDKLEEVQKGLVISLCGLLTGIQRRTSKEGKHWAQMKLAHELNQ